MSFLSLNLGSKQETGLLYLEYEECSSANQCNQSKMFNRIELLIIKRDSGEKSTEG